MIISLSNMSSLQYSLVLNRRHAVIVDMANFKGPKLSQLFDSTAEILLIVFVSTTDQITPIFIKICLEITELWSLTNLSSPCLLLSTKE